MEEEIKKIIDKYDKDILKDSKKFISIFSDVAPSLKKEKKYLQIAFSENIGELFVNCKDNERETCIIKVRRKLESYISEEGLNSVLKGITYGLGWNKQYKEVSKEKQSQSGKDIQNQDKEVRKKEKNYKTDKDKKEIERVEDKNPEDNNQNKKNKTLNSIRIIAWTLASPVVMFPEGNIIAEALAGAILGFLGYYFYAYLIYFGIIGVALGTFALFFGQLDRFEKALVKYMDTFMTFFNYLWTGVAIIGIIWGMGYHIMKIYVNL